MKLINFKLHRDIVRNKYQDQGFIYFDMQRVTRRIRWELDRNSEPINLTLTKSWGDFESLPHKALGEIKSYILSSVLTNDYTVFNDLILDYPEK